MEQQDQSFSWTTATLADIALSFPPAASILNRHNLDYCCKGQMLFQTACEIQKYNTEKIREEILQATDEESESSGIHFDKWEASLLIDFIVQHHHRFVKQSISQIQALLDTVCSIHGEDDLSVLAVRDDFNDLVTELKDHMPREEEILFPAIRRLLDPRPVERELTSIDANIRVLIAATEQDHEYAGELVKSLRSMTRHYTPPDYACPTFRAAYQMLQDFDNDLVQHIHLENNILFQRVKKKDYTPN
jgi:regulator of cell morphogenesis and NO signaling